MSLTLPRWGVMRDQETAASGPLSGSALETLPRFWTASLTFTSVYWKVGWESKRGWNPTPPQRKWGFPGATGLLLWEIPQKWSPKVRSGEHLLPPRNGFQRKGRVACRHLMLRSPGARPLKSLGNDNWWKRKKIQRTGKMKRKLCRRHRRRRRRRQNASRPPGRATPSECL